MHWRAPSLHGPGATRVYIRACVDRFYRNATLQREVEQFAQQTGAFGLFINVLPAFKIPIPSIFLFFFASTSRWGSILSRHKLYFHLLSFESTFFFFLSLSLSHWHFLDLLEIYRIFCFSFFPPNNKNIKKKKVSFDSIFNFQKREREEKLIISRWEANFSPPPTISRDRFQLKFLLVRSLSINFGKRTKRSGVRRANTH